MNPTKKLRQIIKEEFGAAGGRKRPTQRKKLKEPTPFKSPAQKRYKKQRRKNDPTQASGHPDLSTGTPFTGKTKRTGTDRLRFEEDAEASIDQLIDVLNEMGMDDEEPTVNDIDSEPLEQDMGLRADLQQEIDYRVQREELWSEPDVLLETLEKLINTVAGNPPSLDGISRLSDALETPDLAAFVEQEVGMPPLDRTSRSNLMADVDLVLSDYIYEKFERPQQMNEGMDMDPQTLANYKLVYDAFVKMVSQPEVTVAAAIGAAGWSINTIRDTLKSFRTDMPSDDVTGGQGVVDATYMAGPEDELEEE